MVACAHVHDSVSRSRGSRAVRRRDRRCHHLLHHGVHRRGQPGHPLHDRYRHAVHRRADRNRAGRQQHDAADGTLRAPAVRRRAGHGSERLLRVHDRAAEQGAVADRARRGVLGRRAVPADFDDADSGTDRARDPRLAAKGRGRRHRTAAHVHRAAERRADRRRSGDAGADGHPGSPRGADAAGHPHRGDADAPEQSAGVSGGHLLGDGGCVDAGIREAAGSRGERARLLVGLPRARHPRRVDARPAADHRRDSLHGPVRLACRRSSGSPTPPV